MKLLEQSELKLYQYQLSQGKIQAVTEGKFGVSWCGGGCEGMQLEEFDDVEAAIERCKALCEYMSTQDYAEREDYPNVIKSFTVKKLNGNTLHTSDVLISGWYSF